MNVRLRANRVMANQGKRKATETHDNGFRKLVVDVTDSRHR
jgi:hypothetical protein